MSSHVLIVCIRVVYVCIDGDIDGECRRLPGIVWCKCVGGCVCDSEAVGAVEFAGEACGPTRLLGLFLPPDVFDCKLGVGSWGLFVA